MSKNYKRVMHYKSEDSRRNALKNLVTDGGVTHGLSKQPFYISWSNMKSRCDNPNNHSYKDYGQRGISYTDKWKTFEGYRDDMLKTWKKGLTLERLDVNKGYSKENCTWETRYKQSINRRNTRFFEHDGMSKTLSDWARYLGKSRSAMANRYYIYGWSVEDTLLR